MAAANSRILIFKGKGGLRYLGLITSNAYVDRDSEAVSEAALKAWVNSAWRGGTYRAKNTLLFWHDGQPIGDVIWSDMRGAFLIEIAKERGTPFAKAIFDLIERDDTIKWGVSHGFGDKAHEFDGRWKVYRRIDKKETSVLPLAFAANPFTGVKVKNMNLRLAWLKKNAPDAAALEKRLTTDAKGRQRKLDQAGVTRKEKGSALTVKTEQKQKQRVRRRDAQIEEKAIDPTSLAENLTSLLEDVFTESGVEAPADLNDRIVALIESLDSGDAPVDAEMVAEVVADAADELLADEGADTPDDLQAQIADVIDQEEAVSEKPKSLIASKQREQQKQTELLEDLLNDLSVLDDLAETVKELKPLVTLKDELREVKKELRQIKRKMSGGPRAGSDDDDTEVEDGEDADEDVAEFKRHIKNRKNKGRAEGMFADLYADDGE